MSDISCPLDYSLARLSEVKKQLVKLDKDFDVLAYLYRKQTRGQGEIIRETWRDLTLENANAPEQQLKKYRLLDWITSTFIDLKPDLMPLPTGSFYLCIPIKLAKPFFSRGEEPFYIIDNSLAKDPIFGLPLIHPSTWKGCLRSALMKTKNCDDDHKNKLIKRLLGPHQEDADKMSGQLFFYPSLFMSLGLEIINPHNRERRVSKKTLLFECVPPGSSTTLNLLYVPLDLISKQPSGFSGQIAEDLEWTVMGVKAMLADYGFGAKTNSGFGLASETLERKGEMALKGGLSLGREQAGPDGLIRTSFSTLQQMVDGISELAQRIKGSKR